MPSAYTGYWIAASGLLGLIVGAFLNRCIHRIPREASVLRSHACPECAALISRRTLFVEASTAALFAYAAARVLGRLDLPPVQRASVYVIDVWFISSLIICSVVNLEFGILPDRLTLTGVAIAIAACGVVPAVHAGALFGPPNPHLRGLVSSGVGAAVGAALVLAFGVLGRLLSRKPAVGLGVVKLAAMIGALLGPWGVGKALLMATFLLAGYAVLRSIARRPVGYVQVGPAVSAAALVILFRPDVTDWLLAKWLGLFRF